MAEEAPVEEEQAVPVPPLSAEDFESRLACYNEIFADFEVDDAKVSSKKERKEGGLEKPALTYSEVDISVLNRLLNVIKAEHGAELFENKGVFLDLGSGIGRACVGAGLLHPFEKVVGIETLQGLNDLANQYLAKYQEAQLPEGVAKPPIEYIKGDFVAEFAEKLEPLAPTACVCLASATCYGDEELQAITNVAKKMPGSSYFIVVTMRLPEEIVIDPERHHAQRRAKAVKKALCVRGVDPDSVEVEVEPAKNDPMGWDPLFSEEVQLSWGQATAFVYRKVPPSEPAEEAPAEPPAEA